MDDIQRDQEENAKNEHATQCPRKPGSIAVVDGNDEASGNQYQSYKKAKAGDAPPETPYGLAQKRLVVVKHYPMHSLAPELSGWREVDPMLASTKYANPIQAVNLPCDLGRSFLPRQMRWSHTQVCCYTPNMPHIELMRQGLMTKAKPAKKSLRDSRHSGQPLPNGLFGPTIFALSLRPRAASPLARRTRAAPLSKASSATRRHCWRILQPVARHPQASASIESGAKRSLWRAPMLKRV